MKSLQKPATRKIIALCLLLVQIPVLGYYFIFRYQLYASAITITIKNQEMSQARQDTLREYLTSEHFKGFLETLRSKKEVLIISPDKKTKADIKFELFSSEFQSLKTSYNKLLDTLKNGLPDNLKLTAQSAVDVLTPMLREYTFEVEQRPTGAVDSIFKATGDLGPAVKIAVNKKYSDYLIQFFRRTESLENSSIEVKTYLKEYHQRLKEYQHEIKTMAIGNLNERNTANRNLESTQIIVNSIIGSYLTREITKFELASQLGSDFITVLNTVQPEPRGRSLLTIQFLGLFIGLFISLIIISFKTMFHIEYDTASKLRLNYSFDVFSGERGARHFIEKEFRQCSSSRAITPQIVITATMGSNWFSCLNVSTLAKKIASKDKKVLVIDLFRKASPLLIDSGLFIKEGLSDFLESSQTKLQDCIYTSDNIPFSLLPLGSTEKRNVDVTEFSRFKWLIKELKSYDVVIFMGDFNNAEEMSKLSFYASTIYLFAEHKTLQMETHTRLLRNFAVYNGVRRNLITFTKEQSNDAIRSFQHAGQDEPLDDVIEDLDVA